MTIPIEKMKELARRAIFLAVAVAHPGNGSVIVLPLEDFSPEGLAEPAIRDFHAQGFKFVMLLSLRKEDRGLEMVHFPGTFPEPILRACGRRFADLAIERGVVSAAAEA